MPKGGKLRSPVDAWPPELVFFTRVTAMLRGLCSSLEVRHPYPHPYPKFSPNPNPNHNPNPSPKPNQVRHPYLSTMADAARVTLREAVPQADHATSPVQPTPQGLESSPLQARLELGRSCSSSPSPNPNPNPTLTLTLTLTQP